MLSVSSAKVALLNAQLTLNVTELVSPYLVLPVAIIESLQAQKPAQVGAGVNERIYSGTPGLVYVNVLFALSISTQTQLSFPNLLPYTVEYLSQLESILLC